MSSARPLTAAMAILAAAVLAAGCGSATPAGEHSGTPAARPAAPLDTSLTTAGGTWAVAVMGGSAAQHNNFWQLFIRPAGSTRWTLVTPPGTADNGGLVLAGAGGQALITGFRPSQYLTFTPLSATSDNGQAWSSESPLDAELASVPDALAAAPGSQNLLALLGDGTAELAAPGYTSWKTLASLRSLAATPAGRRCELRALTAVAYTPSAVPLLAGTCSRPGAAGIFADAGRTWQATGPAIPAALSRQPITVLRLTQTANQIVALLAAGSGRAASVLAAWSADNGRHWALTPALALNGAAITSASFGTGGTAAVIMSDGRAAVIAGDGRHWRPLPALPPGTATLAPGPAGQTDALAVDRATLSVWRLPPGATAWTKTQTINVPIQYGSSG
jgi:hypothetical protein